MLPYANVTSSNERVISGFVREPDGRGTFGILFSCLAVLLLNTWTVLHLNIPPRTTPWRQYLHKVKWWAIAMICPDGLAVSACEQWRNARTSVKVLKKVYPWWTVTHGYYAEMGGFRIEPETGNKQEYAFRVSCTVSAKPASVCPHDLPAKVLGSFEYSQSPDGLGLL